MSVRAWFTISALALVGLVAAFVFRFFTPVPAPEIVARVGGIRLSGQRVSDCWPQRNGSLRCETRTTKWTKLTRLRTTGTIHLVVAYPVQPSGGAVKVVKRDGSVVKSVAWTESFGYDLAPGDYAVRASADYAKGARVDYFFPLSVTTSGS
jgi:hypothetical protein